MLKKLTVSILGMAVLMSVAAGAAAQPAAERLYIQPLFGKMRLGEEDPRVNGGGYDLTMLGVAVQQPLNEPAPLEAFQYGIETGFMGSWENDFRVVEVSSGPSGGRVAIEVNNHWFVGDLFFGGFVSYTIANRLRLYMGAGPLVVYGRRQFDPAPTPADAAEVSSTVEQGVAAGGYVRGGLEFQLSDQYLLGAGARGLTSGLTFNEPVGDIRFEGFQAYLNFTIKL